MPTDYDQSSVNEVVSELREWSGGPMAQNPANADVCNLLERAAKMLEMRANRDARIAAVAAIRKYASDTHSHWDASEDAKVGKRLLAMSGELKNYDRNLDEAFASLCR